ncbi:MAG: hypothetical protein HY822_00225, partial [Acidobacteria bacterium]|nr:hypothetical protein [Acidobacteriota bacterium]
ALAKVPLHRPSSAERGADDVRRSLAGQPVPPRPATPASLARKFFDRHRAAPVAAALAVIATLAGFGGIVWQSGVAVRERVRAERRFNEVRQLANSFLFEFEESIRDLPGSTPARMLVVKKATEYLDRLAGDAAGDASLELELADAYFRLGDLQGNPYSPNLGDPNGALASYRKAVTISERMLRANPRDRRAQRYVARSYRQLADVLPLIGGAAEALDYARKAVKTFDELAEARAADLQPRIDVAGASDGLGDLQARSGDRDGALSAYRKSLENWQAALGVDSTNRRSQRAVGVLAMKIGDTYPDRGEQEPALASYAKAQEALEAFSAADPSSASARRTLGVLYRKMGAALVEFGDTKAGLERFGQSAGILDALAAADPDNAQARMDLAIVLKSMGETQQFAGDLGGALKSFSRVIEIVETLSLADPSNLERRSQLAETQIIAGGLLNASGQEGEARKLTSRGLAALKQLADRPGAAASELNLYALSLLTCEPAQLQNPPQALPYAERAAEMTKPAGAVILDTLALAAFRTGDAARSVATAEKALALLPAGRAASRTRKIIETHLAEFRKRP